MFFKWLAESLHTVGGSSDGECSSGRQKRRGVGDLGSPGKRAAKTATVFYYLLIHLQRSFGRSHVKSKNTTTRTQLRETKLSYYGIETSSFGIKTSPPPRFHSFHSLWPKAAASDSEASSPH